MASLSRALSYLIAAQFQAIGLILAAWWLGEWLNDHHPVSFNWYAVTFPVAVVGVGQSFYVVIRHALKQGGGSGQGSPGSDGGGEAKGPKD